MYICKILICWQTSVVLFFDLLLVAAETSCDSSILVHYNFFYMVIFTSSRKKEGFCNVSFLLPVNASSTWDPFTSAETVLSRSISPSASGSSVDTAPIHSWYDTHTDDNDFTIYKSFFVSCCHPSFFSFLQWTEFSDRTLARCPHCRKV